MTRLPIRDYAIIPEPLLDDEIIALGPLGMELPADVSQRSRDIFLAALRRQIEVSIS